MKTLKEFMDEKPGISLIGFAWSCYWRISLVIYAVMFAVYIGIALIVAILNVAFGGY